MSSGRRFRLSGLRLAFVSVLEGEIGIRMGCGNRGGGGGGGDWEGSAVICGTVTSRFKVGPVSSF